MKDSILKRFFKQDTSRDFIPATYFPVDGIQVEYQGEIVDCIECDEDGNPEKMYTNQDREVYWEWNNLDKLWSAYELKEIEV